MGYQVTIKDIALKLGLSVSTVSRALSDHPDISNRTKKLVKELADLLGYKPNQIALNLRNRTTKTLGLVIPEIRHLYFSTVISGVEEIAYKKNYSVSICQSNESYKREFLNIQNLLSNRVDGLLVSLSKETTDISHLRKIIENDIPLVLFDRVTEELNIDIVCNDDYNGAFLAVEHLLKKGCRRIAIFTMSDNISIGRNRLNGYKKALNNYNISIDDNLIFNCDTYLESLKIAPEILKRSDRPDGIFAVNDMTAIGVMMSAKSLGIKIPEELKIIGFENCISAGITSPGLTSVDQFGYDIGREAAKLLFDRINNKNNKLPPQKKYIKTKLVQRGST